jgi:hypothetical protein
LAKGTGPSGELGGVGVVVLLVRGGGLFVWLRAAARAAARAAVRVARGQVGVCAEGFGFGGGSGKSQVAVVAVVAAQDFLEHAA